MFSSSRLRACCSAASVASALGGGLDSLAKKMKAEGAGCSPGQSTSTPMVSAFCGRVSVSSSSTQSASSPLAPCTVSRRMACASARPGARTPPFFMARTNA